MISNEEIRNCVETAKTSRQICTLCKECIPKDVKRYSFSYTDGRWVKNFRLCGACIVRLSKLVANDKLKTWYKELTARAI